MIYHSVLSQSIAKEGIPTKRQSSSNAHHHEFHESIFASTL